MRSRSRLLLLPVAALALGGAPAAALDLQTLDQAQRNLAPGAVLRPADFRLTPEQLEQIKREYSVPALRPAFKAWRVEGGAGGWLILDQVYGLHDIITYLLSVGDDGRVRGLEVLVCAEGWCDIYSPEWRAQLNGRAHGKWAPGEAVPILSGSTLSTTHVAEGVKKLLAIHARFLSKSTD